MRWCVTAACSARGTCRVRPFSASGWAASLLDGLCGGSTGCWRWNYRAVDASSMVCCKVEVRWHVILSWQRFIHPVAFVHTLLRRFVKKKKELQNLSIACVLAPAKEE